MEVSKGTKFAAYFRSRCVVADDVPEAGVEVAEGIWAAQRFGAELERATGRCGSGRSPLSSSKRLALPHT